MVGTVVVGKVVRTVVGQWDCGTVGRVVGIVGTVGHWWGQWGQLDTQHSGDRWGLGTVGRWWEQWDSTVGQRRGQWGQWWG
eukprot:6761989-Pyramimonas_sp.AAC.1